MGAQDPAGARSQVSLPAPATAGVPWVCVYEPVRRELDLVAARVTTLATTATPPLGEAAGILAQSPGKLLRPALVLLAGLAGPPAPPSRATRQRARLVAAASAFELLHLASLTHDDILDASPVRRGVPSAWGRWGTEVALLAGNHLYGKAMHQASLAGRRATRSLCRTIDALLTGEVLELRNDRASGRRAYMTLATAKTAVFCAECCGLGAVLAGAGRPTVSALRSYGRSLGQVYQLTDDLLDWRGDASEAGKPCLFDLSRRRFNFPLLVGLARRPVRVGRIIDQMEPSLALATVPHRSRATTDTLAELLAILRTELETTGALEETARYARRKVAGAIGSLAALPSGPPRDNLTALAESLMGRAR